MRFKVCLIILHCLFYSFETWAQWSVYTNKVNKTLKYNLLPAYSPLKYHDGYTFFGPTNDLSENVLTQGIELNKLKGRNIATGIIQFDLKLNAPLIINIQKGVFYINFFTKNVESYMITFEDVQGNRINKIFPVLHDRYQLPLATTLKVFESSLATDLPLGKVRTKSDSLNIAKVAVTITKRIKEMPYEFTLGECKLYDLTPVVMPAKGCFFYQLTKNPQNQASSYTIDAIGNCYPILSFTMFRELNSQSYLFKPDPKLNDLQLKKQTLSLLRNIINKYPYYKERNIYQARIHQFMDSIIASSGTFEQKIKSTDSLINSMSDGHFYIEQGMDTQISGPVYLKEIGGELQVVGIFDESLKHKLNLGDKVTKIDEWSVNDKLNHLKSIHHYGQLADQRNQMISRLLFKDPSDSTSLTISSNGYDRVVKYYYNKRPIIPLNFRPSDQDFKIYNHWSYYRLNNWNSGDWLTFFNHGDELKKSKGVIFDLRGNSGGSEVEAYKIFACFIKSLTVVSHSEYKFNDALSIHGSNIAVPNRYLDLSNKSVIILVDNKTACTSEIFINVLKNRGHTIVVGSERTSGSYASGEDFYLPYNIVFKTNILNKFYPPGEKNTIEFKGIEPDVYVPIYSYKDLYPYDDKIMKRALAFTSSTLAFKP